MIVLALLMAVRVGLGQTDIRSLEVSLKGHQKALLNFSADPVTKYTWQDAVLKSDHPKVRTLAIFTADSVAQKGDVVEIAGKRATLVFDSKLQSFGLSPEEPMTLQLDLAGSGLNDLLPKLSALLFFPSVKDAVAGVPEEFIGRIPYDVSSIKGPKQLGYMVYQSGSWGRVEVNDARYKSPPIVSVPQPEYTEEARKRRYSGTETIIIELSDTAQKSDIWVAKPIDYGLNALAVAAVEKYVFRPATMNGKPVATLLEVEVGFKSN